MSRRIPLVVFPVIILFIVVLFIVLIGNQLHGLATDPVAFLLLMGILLWSVVVVGAHAGAFEQAQMSCGLPEKRQTSDGEKKTNFNPIKTLVSVPELVSKRKQAEVLSIRNGCAMARPHGPRIMTWVLC